MKTLAIILLLLMPFIYSELFDFQTSGSYYISAQEEMLEPEEETKKPEVKKEKKEELKEAQEDVFKEEDREIPEHLKYYKEKYEFKFDVSFQVLWNAIKRSLSDIGCMIAQERLSQTDDGLYRGSLKSDFCVFTMGSDTTDKVLKKYSRDFPIIRGGVWITGRIQHNFIIKEENDGGLSFVHTTSMSGFEDYVTHEVHFWKSNGILEKSMHELINKNIQIVSKEE